MYAERCLNLALLQRLRFDMNQFSWRMKNDSAARMHCAQIGNKASTPASPAAARAFTFPFRRAI